MTKIRTVLIAISIGTVPWALLVLETAGGKIP